MTKDYFIYHHEKGVSSPIKNIFTSFLNIDNEKKLNLGLISCSIACVLFINSHINDLKKDSYNKYSEESLQIYQAEEKNKENKLFSDSSNKDGMILALKEYYSPIDKTDINLLRNNMDNISKISYLYNKQLSFDIKELRFPSKELKKFNKNKEFDASIFKEISEYYGIDNDLLYHIKMKESKGKPNAISSKNAVGYFQFMNETAKEFGLLDDKKDLRSNLYASAEGATRYLIWLNKYINGKDSDINNPENLKYVLAAYNAGLTRVKGRERNHIPNIKETKDYIKDIMLMTKGDGYYIKSNDTLSKISKKFNININELVVNNMDVLMDDQELKVGMILDVSKSEKNIINFEIKSGYNLFKIAKILDIKLDDLKKLNTHIENIDLLKIGDKINIPNNNKKRGIRLSNV